MTCLRNSVANHWVYINEPVINMYENPFVESRVVSQAIFSELIIINHQMYDWSFITTVDAYIGWVKSKDLVKRAILYDKFLKISRLAAHLYVTPDLKYAPIKTLPYASHLQALESIDYNWIKVLLPDDKECFIQKGNVALEYFLKSKNDLVSLSRQFIGLPYTWGGRSSFGYDCSGFIQMLYKQIGIQLPRDSKQQVLDPRFQTCTFNALELGDLIFFGQSEKCIAHVGMFIGEGQFIHATSRENQPWIRISNLSDFEWSGHPKVFYPYRLARQWNIKNGE